MTLTTTLKAQVAANLDVAKDLVTVNAPVNKLNTVSLADGTGSGQADQVYENTETIGASGNWVLDLSAISNPAGQSIKFTNIKAIYVEAASGNGSTVQFGPDATAGFADPFGDASDRIVLPAGGFQLLYSGAAGWGVTENTDDELYFANDDGAASADVSVIIVGVATVV